MLSEKINSKNDPSNEWFYNHKRMLNTYLSHFHRCWHIPKYWDRFPRCCQLPWSCCTNSWGLWQNVLSDKRHRGPRVEHHVHVYGPNCPLAIAVLDRTAAITTSASTALNGPNTSGDAHGPDWVPLFRFPACNLWQCVPSGHMHSRLVVADDEGNFVWDDLAADKNNKLGDPEGSWNGYVKDHRDPSE